MLGRGSPRLNMLLAKAGQKKISPKASSSKKHGGSPREKLRASWNPVLEKTLVDLLHEHKTSAYRGQNGWTSEAWNKIVKEFHEREDYVFFTKAQIQEKEKELKRDYKVLKEAKKQSGTHWNEKTGKITAEPAAWNNIIHSNPRAKKFRNKTFPLFEALGELYDGQTAEGTYNYTSTQQDLDDPATTEVLNLEDTVAYHEQDERTHEVEPEDTRTREEELLMSQRRVADVKDQGRRATDGRKKGC